MAALPTAATALHLLFAGLWAGGVVFVTVGVLPRALSGGIDPDPLAAILGRLTTLSRASAVLTLLTGGYLIGARGLSGALLSSTRGHLVVAMVVLWLALAALVEIGAGRMEDGLAAGKLREPARAGRPFYAAASVVGVALLLVGGALT